MKHPEIAKALAQRVRSLRLREGLTQAELAKRASLTVETVARLERVLRGRSSANANPSLETMAALSAVLGVELSELFTKKEPDTRKGDPIVKALRGASQATRRRAEACARALAADERRFGR